MWRLIVCMILLPLIGCTTQRMSFQPSSFYSEADREISDVQIKQAFEAKPQLKLPAKIAWYSMGTDNLMDSLLKSCKDPGIKNIKENYNIPKSLVEGTRPYFYQDYYYYRAPCRINLQLLRLLSARAKCDIVILVSSSFEEKREVNSWAPLNIFIIPIFLTPYLNVKYHYEGKILIFDVRNGYFYREAKTISDEQADKLTIYELDKNAKKIKKELLAKAVRYFRNEINSFLKQKKTTSH